MPDEGLRVSLTIPSTCSSKTHAFPLTVSITGEGEASATPSGIECSTEESTNALEGDVTLTEAPKAGSGDEFAGRIGCRKATFTTCKVEVTAASEVTAVFMKAGTEGLEVKEGPAGAEGSTGSEGPREAQPVQKARKALPARPAPRGEKAPPE